MPTVIGHSFTAISINTTVLNRKNNIKIILLSIICSILPDIDIIGFRYGIRYSSFWGHRGFSHSICFALLLSILISVLFFPRVQIKSKYFLQLFLNFFLVTLSHGILDALTSGGFGTALFSPFSKKRYFLPWRPIKVSPIGLKDFFKHSGIEIIKKEIIFIVVPAIIYIALFLIIRKIIDNRKKLCKKEGE